MPGIERAKLEGWAAKAGWETLLNRAGTTFRKLPDKDKEGLTEKKAVALMLAQNSLIKRPVLEAGKELLVGFQARYLSRRCWTSGEALHVQAKGKASASCNHFAVHELGWSLRPNVLTD